MAEQSGNDQPLIGNRKYNKQNKGVWGMPVALRGEEGRDKLRKATGIGTHELIRRYPNGATHYVEDIVPDRGQTR